MSGLHMEVGLAEPISSGSQRDVVWVGGEGSQRLRGGRPSLGASGRKACPALLAWPLQCGADRQRLGWASGSLFSQARRDWKEKHRS